MKVSASETFSVGRTPAEIQEIEQGVAGALEMKGLEAQSRSGSVVCMQRVTTVECFPGGAVQAIQGEIKKCAVGFAGTGIG